MKEQEKIDRRIVRSEFDYERFFDLIIKAHQETNHKYDGYIPYEFHLQMALTIAKRFINLIPINDRAVVLAAVISHDAIEDARLTYNDVKNMAISCGASEQQSMMVAEMVRAVTNDGRGRNRDERMPDYIYEEIKATFYAVFVKLCDRLANVNYGLVTGGSMPKKYQKEQPTFKGKLYTIGLYEDMWTELDSLFLKS
jgi:(p)ppGpp synthase/HD superfamily hydrolase